MVDNFCLYYKRFCRHLIDVKTIHDKVSYFDLVHSFRCLVDVKGKLDEIFQRSNYVCTFNRIANRKQFKRSAFDGISTPEIIETGNMTILGIGYSDRIISDEELDKVQYIETKIEPKKSTVSDWFGWEFALVKDEDNNKVSVLIENLIRRISNKYGGSHPSETTHNEQENEEDNTIKYVFPYIDKLQSMKCPDIEYGYLLVEHFAEIFASVTIDFFMQQYEDDEIRKCKELIL